MRIERGHGRVEKREIHSKLLIIDRKVDQGFFIEPRAYSEVHIKVRAVEGRRVRVRLFSKNPVKFDRQEDVSEDTEPKAGSLVLTRCIDQTIIIGSNTENPIEITIIATAGDRRAKFGIFDPLKRLVLREELPDAPPKPRTNVA